MLRVTQLSVILVFGVIVGIGSALENQCLGTCPKNNHDDNVIHLPHQDCTKFCKCDFGIPHEFKCPEGLHFNPKLHVCDRPSHAGCDHKDLILRFLGISRGIPNQPTVQSTSDAEKAGCKGTCSTWEGDKVVHLPHEDCTKFCKCDFGIAFVFKCPAGLHFNPKLEACDRPSHAGCVHETPIPFGISRTSADRAPFHLILSDDDSYLADD